MAVKAKAGVGRLGENIRDIEFSGWKGRLRKIKLNVSKYAFHCSLPSLPYVFRIGRTLVARLHLNMKHFNENEVKKFNSIAGLKILIRFAIYTLHNCCVNCEFTGTHSLFPQFLFIFFCIPCFPFSFNFHFDVQF